MASSDFRVISSSATTGLSRYRLIDVHENEIQSVNEFLDSIALRGLSDETLRTYAYALLSIWKWLRKASLSIDDLTETRLADYIRYLREAAGKKRPPAPRSINLRLVIARSFYRFHINQEVPKTLKRPFQPNPLFVQSSRIGTCISPRLGRPSFRVKVPRRLIVPLKRDEVIRLFESFRTFRDLSLVSLMLFCGLRSREVLSLRSKDVSLLGEELRVHGKGEIGLPGIASRRKASVKPGKGRGKCENSRISGLPRLVSKGR